jgi:hypothetical protein
MSPKEAGVGREEDPVVACGEMLYANRGRHAARDRFAGRDRRQAPVDLRAHWVDAGVLCMTACFGKERAGVFVHEVRALDERLREFVALADAAQNVHGLVRVRAWGISRMLTSNGRPYANERDDRVTN